MTNSVSIGPNNPFTACGLFINEQLILDSENKQTLYKNLIINVASELPVITLN